MDHLFSDGESRFYNLGSDKGYSVREVIDTVESVTGGPVVTHLGPRRPGDPAVLVADSGRIRQDLRWAPQRDVLEIMVRDAWGFYTRNGWA